MNFEKFSASDEQIERGKGLLLLWFFFFSICSSTCFAHQVHADSPTPTSRPECPNGLQYVFLGKKNPYKWFFILISSCHPTGEHPLKCYLQLQYSSMLLAVFPFMCQILTEWFHLFLYLDLLVILLQASLTEMWIFNFKLDITSLRDTQGHQTQHV